MKKPDYKLDKVIWEGWTVRAFIEELAPSLLMIMKGKSWRKPLQSKQELKRWVGENQLYYKKPIPQVVNYFADAFGLA